MDQRAVLVTTTAARGSKHLETLCASPASVQIVRKFILSETIGRIFAARRRTTVFEVFAATGAAVVVTKTPLVPSGKGWIPLRNTAFYAYRLRPKPD